LNYCNLLSLETNGTVEKTLAAYRATKNKNFIALADHIRDHVPEGAQMYMLKSIQQILCALQDGANNIELYVPEEQREKLNNVLKEAICNL